MESSFKSYFRYFPVSKRDRNWGLYVTTAGESRIGPNVPYPVGIHPEGYDFQWARGRVLHDHQIVYISRGRGSFESKHGPHLIEAGTVMFICPNLWHRYAPDPATGWDEHWVGFDGDLARRWLKHKFFAAENPVLKAGREDVLLRLYTAAIDAIKANLPALQQVLAGITSQILAQLYSAQQTHLTGDDQAVRLIQNAIARMQTELGSRLNVQSLARELKVSYTWFRRTFAQHTGASPHQYLLDLRLARARSLLSETSLAVKAVARQSGFEDEHYFCRLFREKVGVTPTQWRERRRG